MLGHEGVAEAATLRLRERLPARLQEVCARYGGRQLVLDAENIHPTAVNVIQVGKFPSVLVTIRDNVSRQGSTTPTGQGGTFNDYAYRYRLLIHQYVTGDSYAKTEQARYRMVLALREVILSDRKLETTVDEAKFDDLTIREELEPGLNDVNSKFLGYAVTEVEVVAEERITVPGDGPAQVAVHPVDLQ